MRTRLATATAVFVLAACAPRVNPAMKARTDELVAANKAKSRRNIDPPARFDPKPWAVGQWLVVQTSLGGEPSVRRLALVGKDARGFWLEIDVQDYRRRALAKLLLARQPRTDVEAAEVVQAIATRANGQPEQLVNLADPNDPPSDSSREAAQFWSSGLVLSVDDQATGRQTVTVPAGIFRGCLAYAAAFAGGAVTHQVRGWAHTEVPINGLVQGASVDGQMTLELLDYGDGGAKSAFDAKAAGGKER